MAFTTSMVYSFGCQSIQFELQAETPDGDLFSDLHLGPFYQKEIKYVESPDPSYTVQKQSCVEWKSDDNTDASLRLVRALAVITPAIGGLFAIVLWLRPCLAGRISTEVWRRIAIVYLVLVTPLQALTFLLFHSNGCRDNPVVTMMETDFNRPDLYDTHCTWDQGSTANVFSVVLWLATGIAMLVIGAPQRPEPGPPETQTVTYQRTTLPDGTVQIQEVAVVKGTAVASSEKV